MDLWLWKKQARTDPKGASAIVKRWHEETAVRRFNDIGEKDDATTHVSESERDKEAEEALVQLVRNPKREQWLRLAGHSFGKGGGGACLLNVRLIHQYLRRMEFLGSDVRLDLQVVYRPDAVVRATVDPGRWVWKTAQSYKWRRNEHINLLELRAILRSLEWRARSASFHSCRFLHLPDSQICLAALTKGRSSSRKINRILRKTSALCVALNLFPLWLGLHPD